ncbi:uncharacterized protein LOC126788712 [Argentina anserina]|uniref:uncharacterized protein LOC126788712 n=1 Tax=Argentina anserina TaxID=57926 RepID=UPI0021765BC0|nr:uncharacterized protein LOC126788712 [Potentilla anserina]
MMMILSRITRGKLSCCLPLNNFVALYHTRETIPNEAAARKVFDEMLQSRPLPPLVRFNLLLGRLVESGLYSEVISFNRQMVLHGIGRDQYTLSTLVSSYCHLKQLGFGLSVLGNLFKMGGQADGIAFDSLIHAFVHEKRVAEAAEVFIKLLNHGHCKSSDVAFCTLLKHLVYIDRPKSITLCVRAASAELQALGAKPKSLDNDYFANEDHWKIPEYFPASANRELSIACERILSGQSRSSSSTTLESSPTTPESSRDSSSSTTPESSRDSSSSTTLESSRDSSKKGILYTDLMALMPTKERDSVVLLDNNNDRPIVAVLKRVLRNIRTKGSKI